MTGSAVQPQLAPLVHPQAWHDDAPPSTRGVWVVWATWAAFLFLFMPLLLLGAARVLLPIMGKPQMPVLKIFSMLLAEFPFFLGLLPLVLGMIFVHELGHCLGGLIAGWEFHSIFLGPFRLMRDGGRLRLYWHRIYLLYGGAALTVPPRGESSARERRGRMLYVAGGPVMSLLFGILLLLMVRIAGLTLPEVFAGNALIPLFAVVAGLMSFLLGIGTLIPQSLDGPLRSDGLQLLRLLRSPKEDGVDPATRLALLYTEAYHTRPREWDDVLIGRLPLLPEGERLLFAYHQELDHGSAVAARDLLQRALDAVAGSTGPQSRDRRTGLALEAAAFEAAWRGDAAAARAWRERAGAASGFHFHGANIAAAALARAEGSAATTAAVLLAAKRELRQRTVMREDLLRAATLERIAFPG
jgi:hypothetical protein